MNVKETERKVVVLSYYEIRDLILKHANLYDSTITSEYKVTETIQVGGKIIDKDMSFTFILEREKLPYKKEAYEHPSRGTASRG